MERRTHFKFAGLLNKQTNYGAFFLNTLNKVFPAFSKDCKAHETSKAFKSAWHPIEFLRKQEQGFDLPTKARVFKQRALQLFTYNETTENRL